MQILSVLAHPRRGSLTGAAFDRLNAGLTAAGHQVTEADLTAEGFDPRLGPADEPDWDDASKVYSPEVQRGGHGAMIRITLPGLPVGTVAPVADFEGVK